MSSSEEAARKRKRQDSTDAAQESAHVEPGPNPPISGPSRQRVLEETPAVPVQPPTFDQEGVEREMSERLILLQQREAMSRTDPEQYHRMEKQRQILLQQRLEEVDAEHQRYSKVYRAPALPISLEQMLLAGFAKNGCKGLKRPPPEDHKKFIEWFAGAGLCTSKEGMDDQEWINILNEVRSQPGCDALVQSGVKDNSKVIVIEWLNGKSREKFRTTECSTQFLHGLAKQGLDSMFAMQLWIPRRVIVPSASNESPGGKVWEVCTAYISATLSVSAMQAIEWIDAAHQDRRFAHKLSETFNGVLSRSDGWAEGEVTHRGQAARRRVFIFRWADKPAQERYKAEVMWPTLTRDGRKVLEAVDSFVDELKDRGLLGFESQDFPLHVPQSCLNPSDADKYLVARNINQTAL